jgi:hypothetical protein
MSEDDGNILYDSSKGIINSGDFSGSIITRCQDESDSLIFSDNIKISDSGSITINNGLKIGFKLNYNKKYAFSKVEDIIIDDDLSSIEYSILIPDSVMQLYDEGQFSDAFPFTINMLHTAGLYLDDYEYGINHLDFFKGEILKNPVSLIENGIIIADRVVINETGDPVFYDCLIIGRNEKDVLSISYEPLMNVKKPFANVIYIIILGIEELNR